MPFLPEGEACAQKLREAQYALEDADGLLDSLPVEFDPAALDQIEERLDLLYKLGLKYGETEEKILSYLEECREKLHAIQFSDQERGAAGGPVRGGEEQVHRPGQGAVSAAEKGLPGLLQAGEGGALLPQYAGHGVPGGDPAGAADLHRL